MHLERCRIALLGRQQTRKVAIDFTNLAVGARNSHAITVGGLGSATHKVIALVSREHEQCIALVDAILRQAREELAKSAIVGFELRHVTRFARAKGVTGNVIIMRIRNVSICDRHIMLLHRRYIGKRYGSFHTIKAWEADVW